MTPHLNPLPPDQWAESLRPLLAQLGAPLNIHNLMAHHPALLQAWMPFRYHIVRDSSLTPRQRELVILRTAVTCGADYEWHHHVIRGRAVGISEAEIDAVAMKETAVGLTEAEQWLLTAVDQIVTDHQIADELCRQLLTVYDATQLLDLIATVGGYLILAVMLKTFDVPLEAQ